MQKKNVNIKYIADKCGVSTATVSRVINNEVNVAEATRKKVLDAFAKYDYRIPGQENPKIKKIGIIMRTNTPDYNAGLLRYITDYFFERNLQVISTNIYNNYSKVPLALDTLYDAGVSGIFLVRCPYLSIKDCLNPRIPHVWLDCNDSSEDTNDIYCVQSDHFISGRMAAMELIRSGCKHPILIVGSDCTHRTHDRNRGFVSEYEKHGITIDSDRFISLPLEKDPFTASRDMIRYLLATNFPFDSIFAVNDWRTLGAYVGVQSMGFQVPQDIKVIGFDGLSPASHSILNISCIRQNIDELARHACVRLDALMNGQPIAQKHSVVSTDFLPGQTL